MANTPNPAGNGFFFPSTGIRVGGQAVLLAIDDVSFPLKDRLCHYLSKPAVRLEPVLTPERGNPDAPDNVATHFYGGVVFEDGRYRMWYYACHWDEHPGKDPRLANLAEGPVCYAESDDGIHWTKPHLGQVDWRGSRRNNVIRLATLRIEGVHVIRDDTDPDPARRYKMVYTSEPTVRKFWTIRTATSADGLDWTDGPELPFDGFIEQSSLYEFNGAYYVNGQKLERSEGGHRSGRQGYAIMSPDFDHWLAESAESFLLPEPLRPDDRGGDKPYDQVHLGVGAVGFGNVLVGLYCIWHNKPYPTDGDWFGMGATSGDFGLVVSNDGLLFREPVKGHVFLHRDDSPPAIPSGVPHGRILCQGNGILNVGDETRIYHGRWANTADIKDYYAEVALATLPRDRWGALGIHPGATEGTVWSAAVTLPRKGCEVALNADGVSGVSVEVSGDRFELIPAFSRANAGKAAGPDGLDVPVRWTGKTLAELGGQTVRFRFRLAKGAGAEPRLYAAYLRP